MIEYALLGPLEARVDGRPAELGGPRQRAVLAVLLVERNQVVSAERLIELVWGEDPPPTAMTALQGHISKLRLALGPDTIRTERPGYVLEVPAGAVDSDRLEAAVRLARTEPSPAAAAALRAILSVAADTPLDGIEIGSVGAAEIRRLEQLRLTGFEVLVDVELDAGRTDDVLADLERLVAAHPYHERFHGQRMLALYRAGRQADALAAYQAARDALDESLGLDPGPELQELERRILVQDPSLDPSGTRARSNLPNPTTALLGRADLVDAIITTVETGTRIVTLTGPGGTGKTRLSIAAAWALAEGFPDGAFWVACASLTEPALVLEAIGAAIGGTGAIAERIGNRRILLVLDNLEQVLAVAADLARLAVACPGVVVLSSSRERLAIRGEHEIHVPVLGLDDATILFAERSRVEADEVVREICARLDALPLAIELAAARTRVLTPAQILDRLDDRLDLLKGGPDLDPRQQTLRRTISWSYDLLDPEERRLFRAIGVFPGGLTLEVASDLLDADLDRLEALVAKSLVQFDAGRFGMLETIRAFALEEVGGHGEAAALEDEIAAWILALVTAQDELVRGPAQRAALARLDAELENVRLAFRRLATTRDADGATRLVLRAQWWMRRRGRAREMLRWIRAALALPLGDPALRGWLRLEEVVSMIDVEPGSDVEGRIDAALVEAEALGDRALIAALLEERGVLPPYDEALLDRAAAMFAELGRSNDQIRVAINAGSIALNDGRFEVAAERCRTALILVREAGNDHGVGVTLLNLGSALMGLGRDAEATTALADGLAALDRVGDEAGRLGAAELGAALLARRGELSAASTLAASAAAARARLHLEPDANDRRISALVRSAIHGVDVAEQGADRLPLAAALERLRETLGTAAGEADVPSPG